MKSILTTHGAFVTYRIGSRNISPKYSGRIEPFSVHPDDFDNYIKKFEIFAINNNVPDDKWCSLFITICGDQLYSILRKLVSATPVFFSYNHIVTVLRKYFNETRITRRDRYLFLSRIMKPDETMRDFIDDLKKLANNCNYGTYLNEALCDKFISSVRDKRIQEELFEVPNSVPFDDLCSYAIGLEAKFKERPVRETPLLGPIIRI